MFELAFHSTAEYLVKLEYTQEDWHLAPIRGHTKIHKLIPFYPAGPAAPAVHGVVTVSQLFETPLDGGIDK
jgi:hypothetical protein